MEVTEKELKHEESSANGTENNDTSGVRGGVARATAAPGRLVRAPAINFPTVWALPGSPDNGTQDVGLTRDERWQLQHRLHQVQVHQMRDSNISSCDIKDD